MITASEILWSLGAATPGLVIAVALLPWRARLYQGHEWWVLWATLWPFLLIYALWFGLGAYRDAWTSYLAKRANARSVVGRNAR